MPDNGAILDAVFRAVDEVNRTLPPEKRLPKDAQAPLLGADGVDSLALVNLIVETELAVEQDFGSAVNLSDQTAVPAGVVPLATLSSLAAYIAGLLAEARHG